MGRTQKKKHKKRSYRLAHGKLVLPDRVLRADFDRQRVLVRGGHPFFFFISLCLWLFFKNQTRFLLCLRFCPRTATRVSLQEYGKIEKVLLFFVFFFCCSCSCRCCSSLAREREREKTIMERFSSSFFFFFSIVAVKKYFLFLEEEKKKKRLDLK